MFVVLLIGSSSARAGTFSGFTVVRVVGSVFGRALLLVFDIVLGGFEGEDGGEVLGGFCGGGFGGGLVGTAVEVFPFAVEVFFGRGFGVGVVESVVLWVGSRGLAGEVRFEGGFGSGAGVAGC